jgi:rfaE bifunctional protein kinase chain/domain
MHYKSLQEVFDAFNDLKVLVIGDAMIDSYVWGKVERISPEAPVPVVQVKKKEKRLGGAANVVKNIQALGATPILCTVIGNDLEGNYFYDLLEKRNIPGEGIIQSDTRKTTVKERFLSGSQHILRVDDEHIHELNKQEKKALKDRIDYLLQFVQAVIFEDYDKGVLSKEIIDHTLNRSNELGIPSIVDPKRKNFNYYRGASLFKPNLKEIKEGLKVDLENDDLSTLKEIVIRMKQKMNLKYVMVTLSEKGILISGNGTEVHIPAHVRTISDVSGAGDTVVSIASLCMALHLSPAFIAELSNLGGGLVCEYLGVVSIDKERLLEEATHYKLQVDQE